MANENTERGSRSSVEISRNSKGWSFTVKVYNEDPILEETLATLGATVEALNSKYPREGE